MTTNPIPPHRYRKERKENMSFHDVILARLGYQLITASDRLCRAGCPHWEDICCYDLLPLTSEGEDCPYYQPR